MVMFLCFCLFGYCYLFGRSGRLVLTKLLKSSSAWRQQYIPSLTEKNWERCFGTTDSNFHEQVTKAISRTATLLFDNHNACILKQNTNTARLCQFVFKIKSG